MLFPDSYCLHSLVSEFWSISTALETHNIEFLKKYLREIEVQHRSLLQILEKKCGLAIQSGHANKLDIAVDCYKLNPFGCYLVLVSKMSVQFLCVFGLIVAELTFVRFKFIVLLYVLLQTLITGAGKGTLITAENNSLQVL